MPAQTAPPLVSIIIPVFNKWEMTAACLHSMRAHLPAGNMEVIVVDNGSTDETALRCQELGTALFQNRFVCLTNSENQGFARACNSGARHARSDILFFLNNDTLWCADILPPLLQELDTSGIGCCGPLLLYPKTERVQHLGVAFLHSGKVVHAFREYPRQHRVTRNHVPLQAITAAALLIRKNLFWDIEGFHEEYQNGYEDLDLCHQVNKQGLRVSVVKHAPLYHLEGQSLGRKDSEAHNFSIYQRRVGNGFATDIDLFALSNGMCLKLNEWLEPYFISDQEIHEQCKAQLQRQGIGAAVDILDEFPCWEFGYHLLLEHLKQAGMQAEALSISLDLMKFCPSLRAVDSICQLAKTTGNADIMAHYLEFKHIVLAHARHPRLAETANRVLQATRGQGREHLAIALKNWFKTHAA